MAEKILFLTGKLAESSLHKVLNSMTDLPFEYSVHQLGLNVAALMTDKMVRHLPVLENNELVGIISIGDLVKNIIDGQQFIIEQLELYISR
jgi:CBS domain-containing protein